MRPAHWLPHLRLPPDHVLLLHPPAAVRPAHRGRGVWSEQHQGLLQVDVAEVSGVP